MLLEIAILVSKLFHINRTNSAISIGLIVLKNYLIFYFIKDTYEEARTRLNSAEDGSDFSSNEHAKFRHRKQQRIVDETDDEASSTECTPPLTKPGKRPKKDTGKGLSLSKPPTPPLFQTRMTIKEEPVTRKLVAVADLYHQENVCTILCNI